jgi:glycosyltransferase involved in cell wall biosynthesis
LQPIQDLLALAAIRDYAHSNSDKTMEIRTAVKENSKRGVDTDLFHPGQRSAELRASWGVGDQDPVAIYVGRLAAEKNLPLAVKAIQRMRDVVPGVKGVFVGSGPLEESLRREHPEIHFAGARRGEELAQHYASADVFVFPSYTETFGNVVLEAMASGLAVLAFDYAAPQLLIRHSVNGFLVPFQDEAAFLEAARHLAGSADLDALRREASATAKTHSWDHIVAQFEGEMNLLTATTSPQDT